MASHATAGLVGCLRERGATQAELGRPELKAKEVASSDE